VLGTPALRICSLVGLLRPLKSKLVCPDSAVKKWNQAIIVLHRVYIPRQSVPNARGSGQDGPA